MEAGRGGRAETGALLLSAEGVEAATGAAEAGGAHREEEEPGCHAHSHPHPHHKLAVHVERVLSIAELQRLQALAVQKARAALLEVLQRVVVAAEHILQRVLNVRRRIALHEARQRCPGEEGE